MNKTIKNWKFTLLFILFILLGIIIPFSSEGLASILIGWIVIILFFGCIYELSRWIRRKKKRKS